MESVCTGYAACGNPWQGYSLQVSQITLPLEMFFIVRKYDFLNKVWCIFTVLQKRSFFLAHAMRPCAVRTHLLGSLTSRIGQNRAPLCPSQLRCFSFIPKQYLSRIRTRSAPVISFPSSGKAYLLLKGFGRAMHPFAARTHLLGSFTCQLLLLFHPPKNI